MRRTKITLFTLLAAVAAFCLVANFSTFAGGKKETDSAESNASHKTTQAEAMAFLQSPSFDEMSSAGQMNIQRMAGAIKVDGVIKPFDFANPPKSNVSVSPARAFWAPATSSFVDPLVNDPTTDTPPKTVQSETAIVLGSGSSVISAFNDSGSFSGANQFTGYSTSANSGSAWTDRGRLPYTAGNGDAGDPGLARIASSGVILFTTLNFDVASSLNIYRSTDNGVTFTGPINGTPGQPSGSQDKQWIATDNFAGPGNGNAYLAWRNFGSPAGMNFTRSTDSGLTWAPSGGLLIASSGQGAQVAVGPDHSVYYEWFNTTNLMIRRSTDLGLTFGTASTVTPIVATGVNGDLGLNGGFRTSTFPQLVVNPVNGDLYTVYPDKPTGADKADIFFRQSQDNGLTWSAAVRVNTDSGTNDQWQPSLAVTPDGTALFVGHYDRRRSSSNSRIEYWGRTATISGHTVTFGCNFPISSSDFPVVIGSDPSVNATYMGDYDVATASNSNFYVQWGDNRLGNPDVRFALVPKAGVTTPALLSLVNQTVTGALQANSCTNLTVTVGNEGCTATNGAVSGTLTTSTTGVSIVGATQSFGTIAGGGGQGTNATPFMISIAPSFACGTTISLTLTMSSGDVIPINLQTQGVGYSFTTATGQTIDPGTVDTGNHADDGVTAITLPFAFTYYGNSFTTANVDSNGTLQFSSSTSAYSNVCPLPAPTLSDPIMPLWDDLRTDLAGSGIFTSTAGSAPNRIFNIEWRATYYSGGAATNFEIRLHETTNQIEFIYGVLNGNGSSATVGLQKGTGSGGATDISTFSCNQPNLSQGLGVTWTFSTTCPQGSGTCTGAPLTLTTAVSRKTHGGAGTFDIPLPASAPLGIECRQGPAHSFVFTFSNPVVSGNASVTAGIGSVSGAPVFSGNTMTVNLTGVADVQTITVALTNVMDNTSQTLPTTSVSAKMLLGDTSNNSSVNGTDVSQTKAQSGNPVSAVNFRNDTGANGVINGTDVSQVKANSGHSL